jgi:hypothetical protein
MWPEVIVQHFALPAVHTVTPVRSGLLHATYRVVTAGGGFVVQRLELFLNKALGRLSSTKAREGAPQWEGKAEMTVRGKPSLD